MNEVETLDDLMPIIAYASPSLCSLLSYNSVRRRIARPTLTCPAHDAHDANTTHTRTRTRARTHTHTHTHDAHDSHHRGRDG
jgi:ABC-type nickel/cobalt efflux system permease component RcnA